MGRQLRVGDAVQVPWGVGQVVEGKVVEVWGDPPAHVRVGLRLEGDEDEPIVLLLSSAAVTAA